MSTAVGNLSLSAAQIALLNRAFIRPLRQMGEIIPGVVISEQHRDILDVTQHPVERGTVIADHAVKQPATVTIECSWSNSPAPASGLSVLPAAPKETVQETYKKLLKMQTDLDLVDVFTGKRKYTNMLLTALEVTTERETENSLACRATFTEVRIVGSLVRGITPSVAEENQRDPAITSPTTNAGTRQLQAAPLFNPQAGP